MLRLSSLVSNTFASRSAPLPESSDPPAAAAAPMAGDTAPSPPAFPLMRLPLELREQVYSYYFNAADHLIKTTALESKGLYGGVYQWDLDILYANKQIYRESKRVWRRENALIKIATPWPSAGMYQVYLMATDRESEQHGSVSMTNGHPNHISSEGLVPIVCAEDKAMAFTEHHAVVRIDSPLQVVEPEHMVVMLADDLPLFARTWYYSALSYPMLNERLNVSFSLLNPLKEEEEENYDDDKESGEEAEKEEGLGIPLALQRKILLPFEHVKGLNNIFFYGFSRSVRSELARLQALPIPSLQQSLESATDLMIAGDAALTNPESGLDAAALEAIKLYKQAFHAIHILIYGRTRRVLADFFFHDTLTEGRYARQTGITIRVLLRLQLVARMVAAYNQRKQWGEAAFWGMRSVHILENSLSQDFEAFFIHVPRGADVALIYLRTGIAFWHMQRAREDWLGELISYADDPVASSDKLWETAVRFLKLTPKQNARAELLANGVPRETVAALFVDVPAASEAESTVAQDGSSTSEE